LLWAAVSRAVRTPSRIDRQLEAPPLLAQSLGFTSEKLLAVEAGYRGQPSRTSSLSLSGFINFYDDIRTTETTNGLLPLRLLNGRKGISYGIEGWGSLQVAPTWRMSFGAATLWKNLELKEGHQDLAPRNSLGNDPKWQVMARSELDMTPRLRLDLNIRGVGDLDQELKIGSYVELGGRLAYQLSDMIELYAAGRNLLHRDHAESNDPDAGQLAQRSIQAGTRLRF